MRVKPRYILFFECLCHDCIDMNENREQEMALQRQLQVQKS